jgi:serine/threonine protein kinase
LKKEGMSDEIKAQIIREIKIQRFLTHPNIVAMYGFTHDAENIYLLLEPCLEGNLFDLIKKRE